MNREKILEVMNMVSKDVTDDAKNFDGQEFNGKNVATYFGNHGAAINAVAQAIIKIFALYEESEMERKLDQIKELIKTGRLPISFNNINRTF